MSIAQNTTRSGVTMKLADALRHADRIGLPNARLKYIETIVSNWGGEAPPSCAIGGAAIVTGAWVYEARDIKGMGKVLTHRSMETASRPNVQEDVWLPRHDLRCPACPHVPYAVRSLGSFVAHIYDVHDWSRTAIADWLDGLEAVEEPEND